MNPSDTLMSLVDRLRTADISDAQRMTANRALAVLKARVEFNVLLQQLKTQPDPVDPDSVAASLTSQLRKLQTVRKTESDRLSSNSAFLTELVGRREGVERQLEELASQQSAVVTEISSTEEEIADLKSKVGRLNDDLDQKRIVVQKSREDNARLTKARDNALAAEANAKWKLAEVQERLTVSGVAIAQQRAALAEDGSIEAAHSRLMEVQSQIESERLNVKAASVQLKETAVAIELVEKERSRITREIPRLRDIMSKNSSAKTDSEENLRNTEVEIDATQNEIRIANQQLVSIGAEQTKIEECIASLSIEDRKLAEDNHQLTNEVADLKAKVYELENARKRIAGAMSQMFVDRKFNLLKHFEDSVQESKLLLAGERDELKRLEAEIAAVRRQSRDMEEGEIAAPRKHIDELTHARLRAIDSDITKCNQRITEYVGNAEKLDVATARQELVRDKKDFEILKKEDLPSVLVELRERVAGMQGAVKAGVEAVDMAKGELNEANKRIIKMHFDKELRLKEIEAKLELKDSIELRIAEERKTAAKQGVNLKSVAESAEAVMATQELLHRERSQVSTERDILESQFRIRNNEIALIHDKIKLKASLLGMRRAKLGQLTTQVSSAEKQLELGESKMESLEHESKDLGTLLDRKSRLTNELDRLTDRVAGLTDQATVPVNVHPMRELEAGDPEKYALMQHTRELRNKVNAKVNQVRQIRVELADVVRHVTEAKDQRESVFSALQDDPGDEAQLQRDLHAKTALIADLDFQSKSLQLENAGILAEMDKLKLIKFDIKRRISALTIADESPKLRMIPNDRALRFTGGGYCLNPP